MNINALKKGWPSILAVWILLFTSCLSQDSTSGKDCSLSYTLTQSQGYLVFLIHCAHATLPEAVDIISKIYVDDNSDGDLLTNVNDHVDQISNNRPVIGILLAQAEFSKKIVDEKSFYTITVESNLASVRLFSFDSRVERFRSRTLKDLASELDRLTMRHSFKLIKANESKSLREKMVGELNVVVGESIIEDIYFNSVLIPDSF